MGSSTFFSLVSESATVPQSALRALAAVLERQLVEDFAPAWCPGSAFRVLAGQDVAAVAAFDGRACTVILTDREDQPGDAGYHSAVGDCPFATIQVPDCGERLPIVLSHELLETCADWRADLWSAGPPPVGDIAFEICDPVEDSAYLLDGVQVSDFVLPAYFDPSLPGPWDRLRALAGPLTLTSGGYWALRSGGIRWGGAARALPAWRRAARRSWAQEAP